MRVSSAGCPRNNKQDVAVQTVLSTPASYMFKHMGHQLVSFNHVLIDISSKNILTSEFSLVLCVVYAVVLLHKVSEQLLVTRPQPSLYQW